MQILHISLKKTKQIAKQSDHLLYLAETKWLAIYVSKNPGKDIDQNVNTGDLWVMIV